MNRFPPKDNKKPAVLNKALKPHASLSKRYPRLIIWLQHHKMLLQQSLSEMRNNPFSTIVTMFVLAIAIALPLGFHSLLYNAQRSSPLQPLTPRISVYLSDSSTAADAKQIMTQLQQWPGIKSLSYISPEQGLQQLSQRLKLDNLLGANTPNPLPAVLVVQPKADYQSPAAMNKLQFKLTALPGIDHVQLNSSWLKRLYYLLQTGRHLSDLLMILFALGIIFIVVHTLRNSLDMHKKEIEVLQLIGAPSRIMRGRLIYRGVWLGVFSSILASIIVVMFFAVLQPSVAAFAATYQQQFQLQILSPELLLDVLLLCGFLGGFSALVAYVWHQRNNSCVENT